MNPSSSYFPHGNLPTNTRTLNRIFNETLPPFNSHFCRSIHNFCRSLLDMSPESNGWKQNPTEEQLDRFSSFDMNSCNIAFELPHPESNSAVSEKFPPIFRESFIEHLRMCGFPGSTFAWNLDWFDKWNQVLANILIKHWDNALKTNNLIAYPIDSTQISFSNQIGVLHRWFLGHADRLRLGKDSHSSQEIIKEVGS